VSTGNLPIGKLRRISSRWHRVSIILTSLGIGLLIAIQALRGTYGASSKLIAACFLAALFLFIRSYVARQPEVYLQGNILVFRIEGCDLRIPATRIIAVRESRFRKTKSIAVKFDYDTGFGDEIRFVPVWPINWPFLDHPVAKELRFAAGLA
jgi:hypothetical protein